MVAVESQISPSTPGGVFPGMGGGLRFFIRVNTSIYRQVHTVNVGVTTEQRNIIIQPGTSRIEHAVSQNFSHTWYRF